MLMPEGCLRKSGLVEFSVASPLRLVGNADDRMQRCAPIFDPKPRLR
jgi:hypothetical protein